MPYIKDTYSIIAECANVDLPNTERAVLESEVESTYAKIEESTQSYAVGAEMVPVISIDGKYYTEAYFLAPFMRDAKISSMVEALNYVAEANGLQRCDVGLLIESDDFVKNMINKSKDNAGKLKTTIAKVDKSNNLAKHLKDKGYPVLKKKSK